MTTERERELALELERMKQERRQVDTERYARIERKLDKLQIDVSDVKSECAEQTNTLNGLKTTVEANNKVINGIPGSNTPGLVTKVDRLEQEQKTLVRYFKICTGVITGSLAALVTWLKTHGKAE